MTAALLLFLAAAPQSFELGGFEWQVVAGQWRDGERGEVRGSGGWLATKQSFGDAVIALEFQHLSGPQQTFGVGFRYEGVAGTAGAGGLGVNFTAGAFNVFEGTGNAWTPVNPAWTKFQPTPLLKPGKNALRIECVGKQISLFLNGQPLAAFTSPRVRGPVVLWVESGSEVVGFSNFKVTQKP